MGSIFLRKFFSPSLAIFNDRGKIFFKSNETFVFNMLWFLHKVFGHFYLFVIFL